MYFGRKQIGSCLSEKKTLGHIFFLELLFPPYAFPRAPYFVQKYPLSGLYNPN